MEIRNNEINKPKNNRNEINLSQNKDIVFFCANLFRKLPINTEFLTKKIPSVSIWLHFDYNLD